MSDPAADLERLRALRRQSSTARPFLGMTIRWLTATGSTNDDCRLLAESSPDSSVVVLADQQTLGRGQYGRTWETPPGLGVLLSFSVPGPRPESAVLTAWASMATASMLARMFSLNASVKWPNDVLLDGRKIAGVLVEFGAVAVVGIGLNVLQQHEQFPPECRIPPTSIALETDAPLDRPAIAAALLSELEAFAAPSLSEAADHIFTAWRERLDVRPGDRVSATLRDGALVGELLDAHPRDGLRLRTTGGVVRIPAPRLVRVEAVGRD